MAQLSFGQMKSKLQIRLRDVSQVTYTDAEQIEILTAAYNDPFVYIYDRDSSLVTTFHSATYPAPGQFSEITDIMVDVNGDGYGFPLDDSAWDVINGNIYFSPYYKGLLGSLNLYIWGKRKITVTDLMPDVLVEYVLEVAMLNAYKMLKATLATRFLKNTLTMGELNAAINESKMTIRDLRRSLPTQRPKRL